MKRCEIWAQRDNEYVRLRVGEIERVESERDYAPIRNGESTYLKRIRNQLKGRADMPATPLHLHLPAG